MMNPDQPGTRLGAIFDGANKWVVSYWPFAAGALTGIVMRLIFFRPAGKSFNAMMGAFVVLVPFLVGAVAVYVAEREKPRSWAFYVGAGAIANLLFVLGTLLILIEGWLCAIVAIPLFMVFGSIGGLVCGAACRFIKRPSRALYTFTALPLLLGSVEQHLALPDSVQVVESSRVIHATPHQIWQQLTVAPDIEPGEIGGAWMYHIGVPLPLSAISKVSDGKLVRHIEMGKAIHFDQVSDDYQSDQRVLWHYLFTDTSFPAGAMDEHVRIGGTFFDLIDTEYAMVEVPGGTELRSRMRYRVSTHFNWYCIPLAKVLVADFEDHALAFYAHRAEALSTR